MEKIFVDSNYFIALGNEKDEQHEKACAVAEGLAAKDPFLVLSNYVFSETTTVLSQRAGRTIAKEVGNGLLGNPRAEIIIADEGLDHQAWKIFKEIQSKDVSFVDCSIIAAMHQSNTLRLLTFDLKDFGPLQERYEFQIYPVQAT
jgi:predicted nucleic acid-binding protein